RHFGNKCRWSRLSTGLECAPMERLLIRVTSLVAFAIVLATDILYIGLIGAQGPDFQPYVPRFVASYLAVMAAVIAIALLPRREIARDEARYVGLEIRPLRPNQ